MVKLDLPAFSSDLPASVCAGADRATKKCLVIGNLRSYGDQALNADGHYIQALRCDRILNIDLERQCVTAECGASIDSIQRRLAPLGFALPVTPGTALLTVGGAIANDVHGKNHHTEGTFGCHVQELELIRTDGVTLVCSPQHNAPWFAATIGGLGLTGAISRATVRIRKISSPLLDVDARRFANLDEFFALDAERAAGHEYSVAWIDCLAKGRSLGRGIYSVANHAAAQTRKDAEYPSRSKALAVPFSPSWSPVNATTLSIFNAIYRRAHSTARRQVHFARWLYPLDAVHAWNKLYGKSGFFQFQCVVPRADARDAISSMLAQIASSAQGSFLTVLKNFGDRVSPGLMSFPMPGTTLALDFPNLGQKTRALLSALYETAAAAGGRVYLAKDACSPSGSVERTYPNLARFKNFLDPGMESLLAQRLQITP